MRSNSTEMNTFILILKYECYVLASALADEQNRFLFMGKQFDQFLLKWDHICITIKITYLKFWLSGCIGGENIVEIDNPNAEFTPMTVKRNEIPPPSESG